MSKSKNITIEIPKEYAMIRLTAKLNDVLDDKQPNREDAVSFSIRWRWHSTQQQDIS